MYNERGEYYYYYKWAKFKPTGEILIVETRKEYDMVDQQWFIGYHVAGSDDYFKYSDFEFLADIEDYNAH